MNLFITLAQATQPVVVQSITTTEPAWRAALDSLLKLLLMAAGVAVTVFVIPWLRAKGMEVQAKIDASNKQGAVSTEEKKALLSERVKRMAVGLAELFADHKFPELAKQIQDGALKDPQAVKTIMYQWGEDLKKALVEQLEAQGVDAMQTLGESYIDGLVERAASAVSPFPGKETAVALLEGGAAQILQHGVDYVRARNRVSPNGADPLPAAAQAAVVAGGAAGGTSMASDAASIIPPKVVAIAEPGTPVVITHAPTVPVLAVPVPTNAEPPLKASGPLRRPQSG